MTSKAVQNTLAKMDPEKLWLEEDGSYFYVRKGEICDDEDRCADRIREIWVYADDNDEVVEADVLKQANALWKDGFDFWRLCPVFYPDVLKTPELCALAVRADERALAFVPNALKARIEAAAEAPPRRCPTASLPVVSPSRTPSRWRPWKPQPRQSPPTRSGHERLRRSPWGGRASTRRLDAHAWIRYIGSRRRLGIRVTTFIDES